MLLLTLLSLPSLLGASRVPCVVSDEYVWTGVGHGSSWLPVRDPGSFCFLTSAGAWNRGSCGLRYDTAVSAWALEFASSLSTFHCGARCVSDCVSRVTQEAWVQGNGAREAMLAESNQSVCAFTHGQNWYLDGERCAIVMRGDFWVLASTSGQAEFACGARCALFDGPTSTTAQVLLSGYGPQSASLLPTDAGFCFLAQGRAFFRGKEQCHVRVNGPFWELDMDSGQSEFECGASCLRYQD